MPRSGIASKAIRAHFMHSPASSVPAPKNKSSAVSEKQTDKLARMGLHSDMDLVLHLPMRYEDETQIVAIA
ncbi:MAG: hypothetical protein NVSMB6_15710 [Burkholderiaceae bacterium]